MHPLTIELLRLDVRKLTERLARARRLPINDHREVVVGRVERALAVARERLAAAEADA